MANSVIEVAATMWAIKHTAGLGVDSTLGHILRAGNQRAAAAMAADERIM